MTRHCFTLQVRARRWQAELAEFFEGNENRAPDEAFTVLTEIFYLPSALASLSQGSE